MLNRRDFYRIQYPTQARPRLSLESTPDGVLDGAVGLVVLDLSETGLRFRTPRGWVPREGMVLTGTLHLPNDEEVDVRGRVIRTLVGEAALDFGPDRIPLKVVLDQQRWLRTRFPFWK